MNKLSIITINYNNLVGLKKTYESVICQTWTDYEWIIIDGGSTDGSKQFIESHQDKFAYWCSEPDKGVYNAMNKGISRALGEYCLFLNSGDTLNGNKVFEEVFGLHISKDIIVGYSIWIDTLKRLRSLNEDIIVQLFHNTFDHQATFIRRSLLLRFPYDEDLHIISDWRFWIEAIIFGGATFEIINYDVCKQERDGISQDAKMALEERPIVMDELFTPIVQKTIEKYCRQHMLVNYGEYLSRSYPRTYCIVKKLLKLLVAFLKIIDKR